MSGVEDDVPGLVTPRRDDETEIPAELMRAALAERVKEFQRHMDSGSLSIAVLAYDDDTSVKAGLVVIQSPATGVSMRLEPLGGPRERWGVTLELVEQDCILGPFGADEVARTAAYAAALRVYLERETPRTP